MMDSAYFVPSGLRTLYLGRWASKYSNQALCDFRVKFCQKPMVLLVVAGLASSILFLLAKHSLALWYFVQASRYICFWLVDNNSLPSMFDD